MPPAHLPTDHRPPPGARVAGRLALLLLAAGAWGCSEPTVPEAEGQWGSSQVSLSLTRTGGRVDYACGLGLIDSTWTRTADGLFTGTGTHTYGGGPVTIDGLPTHPARYTGQLRGRVFALRVELPTQGVVLGTFTLLRGVKVIDGPVCLAAGAITRARHAAQP